MVKKNKFFDKDYNAENKGDIYNFEKGIGGSQVEGNRSEYSDQIYVSKSASEEITFDRNNPVVKTILIVMGLIILVATIYYIYVFFTTM